MRVLLVGHRGTGKSSLLSRIEAYYRRIGRKVECLDLDRAIERKVGESVSCFFQTKGESAFREIERAVFTELENSFDGLRHDVFLAAGGGFDPSTVGDGWRVVWVRRNSDGAGRIFSDRPRLNANVDPLQEYLERYEPRQVRFAKRADEILWLDEGLEGQDLDERDLVLGDLRELGGDLTLLPSNFRSEGAFENWIHARLDWGVRRLELRDDLLSEAQMDTAIRMIPRERLLVSFRSKERIPATRKLVLDFELEFDWPLEFGTCEFGAPRFLSLHERLPGQGLKEALARFPRECAQGTLLKAALPAYDFRDLLAGHQWMRAFPEARVFLPHSPDGRWSWYRLLGGDRQPLNFFREGEGSGADQPTLLQWARRRRLEKSARGSAETPFAAIIGDPVEHSRTPIEQREFFAGFGAPVFAIRMTEDEMRGGGLAVLGRLGLRWAAVTSPLKEAAYDACVRDDQLTEELHAVNTLVWSEDRHQWVGTNTDLDGFRAAVDEFRKQEPLGSVAVWGGGGTLNAVKAVLPDSEFFALRSAENRNPQGVRAAEFRPDTVIWAVGRSRDPQNQPAPEWQPRRVIDLNYAENSPGRDYALRVGARYIPGLSMFRHQAEAQRRFWQKYWEHS